MNILTNHLGRILFGLPFLFFGYNHLAEANKMTGMVPSWIPGGVFWIYLTGIALIGAGIFIIGKLPFARIVSILLALMLLIFILTIHVPGLGSEQEMGRMMSMISLLKDCSLMGASLFIAGTFKK